jgi:hypothetical protein
MSESVAVSQPEAKKPYRAWVSRPLILAGGSYHDGGLIANRAGLQLARIAMVNTQFLLRKRRVTDDIRRYVETYERDGVVAIENFLEPEAFARIQEECRTAYDGGLFGSEVAEDNAVVEESLNIGKHKEELHVTWQTLSGHDRLARLAAGILRRPSVEKPKYSVSFMTKDSNAPAPTRLVGTNYLHADVHYSSGKAWLLLSDVTEENGAFVYAKGTTKLTLARLAYEYDASVRVARARRGTGYKATVPGGVVRAPTEKQMRRMGIVEEPITGAANTLILADVMGFHKRGEFLEGRRREQIQITFTDRPPRKKQD